jgi:site-specific recombinase
VINRSETSNQLAEIEKRESVRMEELLISTLPQSCALAKLLIEKGIISREEFLHKIGNRKGKRVSWTGGILAVVESVGVIAGVWGFFEQRQPTDPSV